MSEFVYDINDNRIYYNDELTTLEIASNGFISGAESLTKEQLLLVGTAIAQLLNKMREKGLI